MLLTRRDMLEQYIIMRHRITQWNDMILYSVNLERYTNAISDKGAALDNYIGFIDGTVREICRPTNQIGILK